MKPRCPVCEEEKISRKQVQACLNRHTFNVLNMSRHARKAGEGGR